ncbi:response regulator transcription factor [Deinococcus sp. Arct2-2]|uniref:LuxR C-terminal-related transcriptional regulator n=1 Tax=Deinococcus sp. Arct2-2 TaxID=2568653 RepID=UPI0010A579DD|nr:response regulator transcription factor [Deinococcus sp. Arct2-2]THF69647.1 response regulator transcription factor [Deinococcus sp. Arct2-2]
MTEPAVPSHLLPSVRVAVRSGMLRAGVESLLGAAGVLVVLNGEADVLIVDDAWLADPDALADALADSGAIVAMGSGNWANLLPELTGGGWAILSADATPAELLAGVLGAAAGLVVLPPALFQAAELDSEDTDTPPSDVTLTPREHDVLVLLAEGLSNKRAARELGVTESTIKFHVQAVYSKLGVQSRAGAVARGIGLGLVSV